MWSFVSPLRQPCERGDRVEMSHDLERILPGDDSRLQRSVMKGAMTVTSRYMRAAQSPMPGDSKTSNSSSLNEFLLLPFADKRELQLLHFSLFLGIYLAALLGNGLIITAIACDHHLHTPMYFFLLNLSLLDLGSISTTVPKSMANSLRDTRAISYSGCAAQVFLVVFLFAAEYSLLTVMAYDRFVAICRPLHYETLMGSRACVKMAAAAWASGFLYAALHSATTFSISFCQGNTVDQFFCEIPQILKLSCSDAYLREVRLLVVSGCLLFGCFIFIVVSYVQIFTAVLRIPSEQGQHKAFSMCLPHLAVVSLFVSTGMFAYLKPPSLSSPAVDLVVAVLYAVVPPAVNPLIYSMRNKELQDALRKVISWTSPMPGESKISNGSSLIEFLLLAFVITRELQLLHFSLFLGIYLAALLAVNPLIYSMRNKELKEALSKLLQVVLVQQQ
ncbi:olfactory receptor 14A16-like [Dromaius novaehollandiae]|uniref:olfactory receptor 14A16-like n=1 Tax=Dromaius novaehollandiae TaxID=8790 RepID=UPI00311E9E83